VICYNDYGVVNPEGISETPLRLPKCKHIFGDHCIKRWLKDSNTCPYCREPLPVGVRSREDCVDRFTTRARVHRATAPNSSGRRAIWASDASGSSDPADPDDFIFAEQQQRLADTYHGLFPYVEWRSHAILGSQLT
jgi:hypothetical protein